MKSNPGIVVAGKSRLAVECLKILLDDLGFNKEAVTAVLTRSDIGENSWQPSLLAAAQDRGVPAATDLIALKDGSIIFSLEFDRIIIPSNHKFLGMFNIHFSALPAYKGCWNSILPILNGETTSGVTIHEIDEGIDTGNIIDRQLFSIPSHWRACDLYEAYIENGIELFRRNVIRLISGDFSSQPQSLVGSTYASRKSFNPQATEVSCRKTWVEIDRFVRALYFPAYQTATFEGKPVLRASLVKKRSANSFGVVEVDGNKSTDIQCIDSIVRLWHSA